MKIRILLFILLCPLLLVSEEQSFKLEQTGKFSYQGLSFKNRGRAGQSLDFYLLPQGKFTITNGTDARDHQEIPHFALAKFKNKKFLVNKLIPIITTTGKELNQISFQALTVYQDKQLLFTHQLGNLYWLSVEKGRILKQVNPEIGAISAITSLPNGEIIIASAEGLWRLDKNGENKKTINYPIKGKIYGLQAIDGDQILILSDKLEVFSLEKLSTKEILSKSQVNNDQHFSLIDDVRTIALFDGSNIRLVETEPLVKWGTAEWLLFSVLGFIFIFSTIITILVAFRK